MSHEIEFVDGQSGHLLRSVAASELPPTMRAVYLREGREVASPDEADEIVPIVRVVRLLLDDAGAPADPAHATAARVQEYDAEGRLRRETLQVRSTP